MRNLMVLMLIGVVIGCNSKTTPTQLTTQLTTTPMPDESDGHSHERGQLLLADAGPYHALLTAHLSKEGHELDIFFETSGKKPTPVSLPIKSIKAAIQIRTGEGELKEVEFLPAPASERPKDEPAEECSHFVAKVPWLNPDASHRVTIQVLIKGREEEVRWNDFVPRKYAHHAD